MLLEYWKRSSMKTACAIGTAIHSFIRHCGWSEALAREGAERECVSRLVPFSVPRGQATAEIPAQFLLRCWRSTPAPRSKPPHETVRPRGSTPPARSRLGPEQHSDESLQCPPAMALRCALGARRHRRRGLRVGRGDIPRRGTSRTVDTQSVRTGTCLTGRTTALQAANRGCGGGPWGTGRGAVW